ncbi:ABC transporter substrate-binding protein [Crossiella cryophila]|uniref:Multiple sugar transport system substrate-binding protein n=1 Tax=Crossiella cryophila TaxID=43355 RepID=A0A7W7CCG3_9PSEU|nr:extracellular solute-binding protein [Crossiella cryophila]MBB4677371.1 multiple sugar transport system substrate-binding protein [Crossiella cryophila]
MRKLALLSVLALVFGLAACGGGAADGETRLRFVWWGNQDRATLTERAVRLFEQRNPGVRVDTTFTAFGAYWEKLATETAGGNPPDVIQMDYRYLNEYAGRGVLLDLSASLGKQIRTADWNQGLIGSGKVKDKQVGVPFAQNATTIVYDPKPFAAKGVPEPKLGWTWQDYLAQATRLSEGQVAGATDFAGTEDVFEMWLRQHGKQLYTADGQFAFGEADLRAFWQLAARFRAAGAFNHVELTSGLNQGPEQTPLGRRRTATEHSYDSIFGGYHAIRPGELKLAPYPSDDPKQLGQYRKPSQLLSVFARTKQQATALKLVDFLLNDEEAGKILGATRGLPPNLKIRAQVAQTLQGADRQVYDYETALDPHLGDAPPPPPKGDGAVYKLMQRLNEEVVFGRKSIDEAVKQFFADAANHLK